MSKKEKDEGLTLYPGDSVLVIGEDGNLKKVIMPSINPAKTITPGEEKLLTILKMFDSSASLEAFHDVKGRKLN